MSVCSGPPEQADAMSSANKRMPDVGTRNVGRSMTNLPWRSVVSRQLSVVSCQLTVVSGQLSVLSRPWSVCRRSALGWCAAASFRAVLLFLLDQPSDRDDLVLALDVDERDAL